jgi:alpha-L-arabinofuranosidase
MRAYSQGGTFTQGAYYEWKNWRGPAWLRPSLGAQWGASLISGWGPFEMIDMCNALGFQPIITTSMLSSAQDFADLVEYMYGNSSTEWGAARYRDGHPMPYQATFFELGNEQYNPNYVEQVSVRVCLPDNRKLTVLEAVFQRFVHGQVAAMEAVAAEVGMPKTFYYSTYLPRDVVDLVNFAPPRDGDVPLCLAPVFPNNPGPNAQDAAKAQALGLGDHVVTDIHVGAGGGIEAAEALFASNPAYSQGAVNCEVANLPCFCFCLEACLICASNCARWKADESQHA